MYVAQNYDVPKVDDPEKVLENIQKLFGEAKKEIEEAKKKVDKWTTGSLANSEKGI